jgi:hypothetical protein
MAVFCRESIECCPGIVVVVVIIIIISATGKAMMVLYLGGYISDMYALSFTMVAVCANIVKGYD